jgi:L-alanine-DL-glutamate epimerase-like enolase superfamily enzyme
VALYDKIADLSLEIEGYELEGLEMSLGPEFTRLTTLIKLRGGGEEGIGEDVTYDGLEHIAFRDEKADLPLEGSWTIDSFSQHLDSLELFPYPPSNEAFSDYRRWAFESAALDLALRQAGKPLAEVVERDPQPVTFVVSMRLDPPGDPGKALRMLERYPGTRLKLDPTNEWTQELIDQLAATGRVDSADLKGFYRGTPVDVVTDPELYRMVAEGFPDAWLEDPDLTEETDPVLEPHRDRITWDAPIHSVEDIESRPFRPKMVNIKPSRFGPLSRLFAAYDFCDAEGIGAYGGGQTELSVGRGHIQYLASLFHPDTPNDVAPGGYNNPDTPEGLPASPLQPAAEPVGFRWRT